MRHSDRKHHRILFVCLGNICRSPLAEGVFRHLLRTHGAEEGFEVDSAGTGAYHVGERPDARAAEVAERNGVRLEGRARQVQPEDLRSFDYIIAMDSENLRNLERMSERHDGTASLHLLREFDPEADGQAPEVPDPYYGGPEGFERVFRMVERSCLGLLEELSGR